MPSYSCTLLHSSLYDTAGLFQETTPTGGKPRVPCRLPLSVHPHVQGSVLAEGESSVGLIHLHGGAAGVHQDGVHAARLHIDLRQQRLQLAEPAQQRFHPAAGEKGKRKKKVCVCVCKRRVFSDGPHARKQTQCKQIQQLLSGFSASFLA